jgi:hypothetical protein
LHAAARPRGAAVGNLCGLAHASHARRHHGRRYHIDYGAKAGDYVGAFMAVINWTNVDRLFEQASAIKAV